MRALVAADLVQQRIGLLVAGRPQVEVVDLARLGGLTRRASESRERH